MYRLIRTFTPGWWFLIILIMLTGGIIDAIIKSYPAGATFPDVDKTFTGTKPAIILPFEEYEEEDPAPLHMTGMPIAMEQLEDFIMASNRRVFPALATLMVEAVVAAGEEFSIPPVYLLALAYVESSFNYAAVSSADCVGLMQINPAVWITDESNEHSLRKAGIAHTVTSLYDPKINFMAGAYILSHYWEIGKGRGVANPLKYALTRYLGGEKNNHYARFEAAVGKFYVFTQQQPPLFFVDSSKDSGV